MSLLLLFFGVSTLAFITSHATLSVDPPNRYLVAKSMVDHRDLKIRLTPGDPVPPGTDLGRDGNYYSRFGIGQPLIFTGPYFIFRHILGIQSDKLIRALISLTVFPLNLAFTALVFYCILREFGFNRRRCYLAAALLVFATGLWQLSKEGQEGAHLALLFACTALTLRRYQNTGSLKALAASALAVGFAFLIRSDTAPTVICYLIFAFYLIRKNRRPADPLGQQKPNATKVSFHKSYDSTAPRKLASDVKSGDSSANYGHLLVDSFLKFRFEARGFPYFLVAALTFPALLIHMYITYTYFGHPFAGEHNPFSLSFLPRGLLGLLFSPGKSLFLYNPIFLLALAGFVPFYRRHRSWALFIASAFTGCLLLHAAVDAFHGNCCWGPRYLCRQFPLLFIPVAFFAFYPARLLVLRKAIFTLIAACSLLVQIAAVSLHHNRELHELAMAYNVGWSDRQWTMFEPEANFLKIRLTNLKNSLDEMAHDKIAPWPTTSDHLLSDQEQLNAPTLHYPAFWPYHLTYYLPAVKPNLATSLWTSTLILLAGLALALLLLTRGYLSSKQAPS
ncbi:MAG: hypothetical protein AMJ79_15355 [Phycisphaerae bacterium SM23_30]|nr:MAG: hypothetical protein AMJ79_15355 [Phycisphaerae bacterium SM23_30]